MDDNVHKKCFYYNIRGHDFLSYSGHWIGIRGVNDVGYVETAFVPISESSLLDSVRLENEQHKSSRQKNTKNKYSGLSMISCLGPRPGSLFVDAYKLKFYQWENLPEDLNRVLLGLYRNGYEKCGIEDVQMNALGGWVILLNRGIDFRSGGELPYELKILLQDVQRRKLETPRLDTSIYVSIISSINHLLALC